MSVLPDLSRWLLSSSWLWILPIPCNNNILLDVEWFKHDLQKISQNSFGLSLWTLKETFPPWVAVLKLSVPISPQSQEVTYTVKIKDLHVVFFFLTLESCYAWGHIQPWTCKCEISLFFFWFLQLWTEFLSYNQKCPAKCVPILLCVLQCLAKYVSILLCILQKYRLESIFIGTNIIFLVIFLLTHFYNDIDLFWDDCVSVLSPEVVWEPRSSKIIILLL